eukprot:CAMPEP_0113699126 /NCGR_PEP_ID=MMETSP0038_2-20120614/23115_1 /TAXON_ID=2898 /ORGANISM="Cryptomonas paramecium" /LENGTH=498 /DNA_ID=CAMNT_0000622411 /DNA_START=100 /DNA_END=1592 /DNA_ORIENTATION=+ /assembly_acc=CAM_ASM_000170
MTKQDIPLCVSSEDLDHEAHDSVGMYIKSPAFMPFRGLSLSESLTLTPSACPSKKMAESSSVKIAEETEETVKETAESDKLTAAHKHSKYHKSPSMTNVLDAVAACQDGESGAAQSAPHQLSPDLLPADHKLKLQQQAQEQQIEVVPTEGSSSPKQGTLDHTVGTVPSWTKLRKSRSMMDVSHHEEKIAAAEKFSLPKAVVEQKPGKSLLFVLDMDHTMVGNLVAMSDRDNIETNINWNFWPEGVNRGLTVEEIIPFLERGMLRPGLIQLLQHLHTIGSTVVVYTHSEKRWATKVCEAMEHIAGWKFITRLFSRMDCRDGHPHFLARKSLEHVVMQMHEEPDFRWSKVEQSVMFDDDNHALNGTEQCRLVQVPSYDYWEPCPWNTTISEEVMDKNDEEVVDMARRSVVEWGIAAPSFVKGKEARSEEETEKDRKWTEQQRRKTNILLSYNKVAKLDRVMHSLREVLEEHSVLDETALEALPEKFRVALGDAHAAAAAA